MTKSGVASTKYNTARNHRYPVTSAMKTKHDITPLNETFRDTESNLAILFIYNTYVMKASLYE